VGVAEPLRPLSPVSRVALRAKTFSGSRLLVARQDAGRLAEKGRPYRAEPVAQRRGAFLAVADPGRGPVTLSLG